MKQDLLESLEQKIKRLEINIMRTQMLMEEHNRLLLRNLKEIQELGDEE